MKKIGSMILKSALTLFMVFAIFGVSKERISAENNSSNNHGTENSERSSNDNYDKVDEENISLYVGDNYKISTHYNDFELYYYEVKFSSDKKDIASVDDEGNITANAAGDATIYVSLNRYHDDFFLGHYEKDIIKKVNVHVEDYIPVSGIKINNEDQLKTIYVGEDKSIDATIEPSNATKQGIEYTSSNQIVATVDKNGGITALKEGTTEITLTSEGENKNGRTIKELITVNVIKYNKVAGLTLKESSTTLVEGDNSYQIKPIVSPDSATDKGVTYQSLNQDVATVDGNGKLTAIKKGETEIVVKTNGVTINGTPISKSFYVTVKPKYVPVTGIDLKESSKTITMGDDHYQIRAAAIPSDASNQDLTYCSKNKSVATVDKDGKVKAVHPGNTIIVVTSKGSDKSGKHKSVEFALEVKEKYIPVTSINVSESNISLFVNDSYQVRVTVNPSNATNKCLTYTNSNNNVAAIDKTGKITAKTSGTTTITVNGADGKTAAIEVKVTQPVTGIKIGKPFVIMEAESDSYKINPRISPKNATEKGVTYSSTDSNIAEVDSEGNVKANSKGFAIITVTSNECIDGKKPVEAKLLVGVMPKYTPVSNVAIQEKPISLLIGTTKQVKTVVYPEDATNKELNYSSSDTKIFTVDKTGKITAKAGGTATLTVESKDKCGHKSLKNDSVQVTVIQPVTGIEIQGKPVSLLVGGTKQINAVVSPSDATNKALFYKSSNEKILTVDKNGLITAKAKGIAVVSVESKGSSRQRSSISDQVVVAVIQPVKDIKLDKTETTVEVGDSYQIPVSIEPTDATYQRLIYKSEKEDVAEVDNDGKITAKSVGNTSITVTSSGEDTNGNNVSVTFNVTVDPKYVPVEDIDLDKTIVPLSLGESYSLNAKVKPENATEQGLTYGSSDKTILTVNENGEINAKAIGMAEVTITSEGKNKSGENEVDKVLVVVTQPVAGIELDQDSTVLKPEDKYQIKAKVTPDKATRKGITYTSEDETIATVDKTGEVTAVAPGVATIDITSDGHDKTGEVVEEHFNVIVANIELNASDMKLTTGETFQINTKFKPEDVANSAIVYGSSDSNIVSVDENGEVKALKEGTAEITVSSEAYNNISESFKVTVEDKKDEVNTDLDKDNPTKPTEPTKTKNPTKSQGNKKQTKDNQQVVEKAKDPITGDSTNVTAVVIIMIASGAIILYLNRKKKFH